MITVLQDLDIKWHEKFAKASFNKTWDLLEKKDRSPEEDNEMVHTAHSSRYHWGVFIVKNKGIPVSVQCGE